MGDFQIVFVSSDRDEEAFKEYFAEMPWLALDYANRKEKEQLSNLFGVQGIPSFVIVDKDGSTITKEGRAAVSSDPEGAEFPWYPLAKKYIDEAKCAEDGEDPKFCFMIAKGSGGISGQLRSMLGFPSYTSCEMGSKLMLVNLPDDGAYYDGPEGDITTDVVEKFVADFMAGTLQRKQVERN